MNLEYSLEYCPLCGHLLMEYVEYYNYTTKTNGPAIIKECIWCGDFKQKETIA